METGMVRQRSRKKDTLPDPQRFNLESFATILPERQSMVGEDAGSWEAFHAGMRQSLNPGTPYEAVIAENLIAIEWELLQHRSMREAVLRKTVRNAIRIAVENAGGEAAVAKSLADRAVSSDTQVRERAYAEISELGMEPVELMGEAYRGTLRSSAPPAFTPTDPLGHDLPAAPEQDLTDGSADFHDEKIRQLERRRREVKRDYDQLRQSRPDEGAIIEQ
jgi:hypothetical protein